ncbi:11098_t:CDS:2, partial [Paraglomus occultum]
SARRLATSVNETVVSVYLPTHESLLALTQEKITTVQGDGVLDSGWYRLGCSLGILDTHQAADVEAVEAAYGWTGWHPRNNYLVNSANRKQSIDETS